MAAALPPNWTRYTTDEGKEYFHNGASNVTTWETPEWPSGEGLSALSSFSASEVFQYTPSASDLDTKATAPFSGPTAQALGSPGGHLAESELVSLTGAPSGRMASAPGAGAGGGSSASARTVAGAGVDLFAGLGGLVGAMGGGSAGSSADGEGGAGGPQGWLLNTAQRLFDVSTEDVVARLRLALIPYPAPSAAAKQELRDRPDFYGPFWVATTAVLFLAATGNFARLLAVGDHSSFKADYGLVSMAAGIIYGFLLAVPVIARTSLFFAGEEVASVDFRQMICVCGYSLAPAIPVSLLCLIPLESLRWLAVLAGLAISLLFVRHHLVSDISVNTAWLKWTLVVSPCIMPVAVFFLYRVHFFTSRS
mmetsp:Transcript_82546/g.267394  ORF Transcript_82546/g.267394 Transcript_82546/m.267394 type:complete len:365 (+) Transcript_82546:172-1266(+)